MTRAAATGRGGLVGSLRLQKLWLWLGYICVVVVLADVFFGVAALVGLTLPVSPAVAARGFLVAAAALFIVRNARRVRWIEGLWVTVLFAAMVPSLVISVFSGGALIYDSIAVFRALYLPIVALFGLVLMRRYELEADDVLRAVEWAGVLFAASLVLPGLLGVQVSTYGDYAFGDRGIFYAANDVSVALGVSMFAVGYRLLFVRQSWLRAACLLLAIWACIQLGSRASLAIVIGFGAVMAAALAVDKGRRLQKGVSTVRKWGLGLLVVGALGGGAWYGFQMQVSQSFQEDKLLELAQGQLPRLALMQAGMAHIGSRSVVVNIFGEGADLFERGVGSRWPSGGRRMTEVDFLDSVGRHGIVFTVLIHAVLLAVLVRFMTTALRYRSALMVTLAGALTLYLGHATLAGHALFSPTPSSLLALFVAVGLVESRRMRAEPRYA